MRNILSFLLICVAVLIPAPPQTHPTPQKKTEKSTLGTMLKNTCKLLTIAYDAQTIKHSYLTTTGHIRPLPEKYTKILDNTQFRFFSRQLLAALKNLDPPEHFVLTVYSGSAYSMVNNTSMHDLDFCLQQTTPGKILQTLSTNGFSFRTGYSTAVKLMQFTPQIINGKSSELAASQKLLISGKSFGCLTEQGQAIVKNPGQKQKLIKTIYAQVKKQKGKNSSTPLPKFPLQTTMAYYTQTMEFVLHSLPDQNSMDTVLQALRNNPQTQNLELDTQYTWVRHFSDFKDGVTINALRISLRYAPNGAEMILSSTIPSLSPLSLIDDMQAGKLKIVPTQHQWLTSYTLLKTIDYATAKALTIDYRQNLKLKFRGLPDNKTIHELEDARAARIMFEKLWKKYEQANAIGNLMVWMFEYHALDRPLINNMVLLHLYEKCKTQGILDSDDPVLMQNKVADILKPRSHVRLPPRLPHINRQTYGKYSQKLVRQIVKRHEKTEAMAKSQILCAA